MLPSSRVHLEAPRVRCNWHGQQPQPSSTTHLSSGVRKRASSVYFCLQAGHFPFPTSRMRCQQNMQTCGGSKRMRQNVDRKSGLKNRSALAELRRHAPRRTSAPDSHKGTVQSCDRTPPSTRSTAGRPHPPPWHRRLQESATKSRRAPAYALPHRQPHKSDEICRARAGTALRSLASQCPLSPTPHESHD